MVPTSLDQQLLYFSSILTLDDPPDGLDISRPPATSPDLWHF